MRVLYWLMGLANDLFVPGPPDPPERPQIAVAECHMHGCGNPAHPGEVLCHPHLMFERLDFYNPQDGWGQQ